MSKVPPLPPKLTSVRVRQLQLFAVVAEAGSISEAARRLHVTQPAATEMIKDLERSFSGDLMVRGPKGVVLTPYGLRVAEHVIVALRELQHALVDAERDEGRTEVIRVGFVPIMLYEGLSASAERFMHDHPRVRLKLTELKVSDCSTALIEGDIDVALTVWHAGFEELSTAGDLVVAALEQERVGGFMSNALKLPPGWTGTPTELVGLPWVLPSKGAHIRGVFDSWFVRQGLAPPEPAVEVNPVTAAAELLRGLPYAGLLPQRMAGLGLSHLRPIPSTSFELSTRQVAAYKRADPRLPLVASFVAAVLSGERRSDQGAREA